MLYGITSQKTAMLSHRRENLEIRKSPLRSKAAKSVSLHGDSRS